MWRNKGAFTVKWYSQSPVFSLQGIHLREMKNYVNKIWMWVSIQTLFIIAEKFKQLKCPLINKWRTKNMIYSYHAIQFGNKKEWSVDKSCNTYRRRQWHPTPVLLPGKSHGWRSLVGCSPWGRWGSDMTERLHFHFSLSCIEEGNGNPLQCSCLENPRDGEPGGLPSMGLHRVGHDWSDSAAAVAFLMEDP